MDETEIIAPYAAGVIIHAFIDTLREGQFVSAQEMSEVVVGPYGQTLGNVAAERAIDLLREVSVLETRADPALGGLYWINVAKLKAMSEGSARPPAGLETLLNYFKSKEWIKRAKAVCYRFARDLMHKEYKDKQRSATVGTIVVYSVIGMTMLLVIIISALVF